MRILIKGGHVIDPANDIDKPQDLYIADGRILSRGRKPQDFEADRVIDATGLVVCPGLVDMRARLREPGQEKKGSITSETKAAVKAGVTTVCCPPDTDPVIDTPAVVELIHQRAAQAAYAKVYPLGALTYQLKGEQLAEMSALKHAGCVGVSNALKPVDPKILRRAMEYAAGQGLTVYLHPEDPALSQDGCAHEGTVSVRLGLAGIPETAETVAVAQALQLIDLTGVNAHFCQLSSAAAARMIARAQYDGLPITVDVTAHQLFLTEVDIGFFNAQCHVRPPLRTQRDRDGLREALVNGTISAICSDHQPHDADAKLAPFPATEPGISAIETLLPLTLRLVDDGLMSLSDALSRVTLFPANILDIKAGTLDIGAWADVCIFHPHYSRLYEEQHIVSDGKNTPFLGWNLKGFVTHTLVNGKVVHEVDEATLQEVMTRGAYEAQQAGATAAPHNVAVEGELDEETDDFDVLVLDDLYEDEVLQTTPQETPAQETTSQNTAPQEPAPQEPAPQPVPEPALSSDASRREVGEEPATKVNESTEAPQAPSVQQKSTRSKGRMKEKRKAEPRASTRQTETSVVEENPTDTQPSESAAQDTYKPAYSGYKVPPKKFAPLSDRVVNIHSEESGETGGNSANRSDQDDN